MRHAALVSYGIRRIHDPGHAAKDLVEIVFSRTDVAEGRALLTNKRKKPLINIFSP